MWGLSTAQKETEREPRGAEQRRERYYERGDLGDPLAPTTEAAPPGGSGAESSPSASAQRHLGLQRPSLGSTKKAGVPSFPERKLSTEMPCGVRHGARRGLDSL